MSFSIAGLGAPETLSKSLQYGTEEFEGVS